MDKRELDRIKTELAQSARVIACAKRFGTIGDPTAMRICYLLRNHPELSVGEIAELVGVSISAASRSLKKMREAEFVQARRDKKTVFYRLQNNSCTRIVLSELEAAS
jgi:DNA-binding transcriptional ArsR family regulator